MYPTAWVPCGRSKSPGQFQPCLTETELGETANLIKTGAKQRIAQLRGRLKHKSNAGRQQATTFKLCKSSGCLRHQNNSSKLDAEAQTSWSRSTSAGGSLQPPFRHRNVAPSAEGSVQADQQMGLYICSPASKKS